jgi:hypothetical protein
MLILGIILWSASSPQTSTEFDFVAFTASDWRASLFFPGNMPVSRGTSFALSWHDQREEYNHEFSNPCF